MGTISIGGRPLGRSDKGIEIALWTAQSLLAVAFAMAGGVKVFTPIEVLAKSMDLAARTPLFVRLIGLAELAGAVGVVLPALTRIKPALTALAAAGLCVVMVLAVLFHLSRGEFYALPVPIVLGMLASFVAWGRSKRAPIQER